MAHVISPLLHLIAVIRGLLSGGWISSSISPLINGETIAAASHPSGREIEARINQTGDSVDLTLTGLTLEQVTGAIVGAGLVDEAATEPADVPDGDELAQALRDTARHLGWPEHQAGVDLLLALPSDLHQRADMQRYIVPVGAGTTVAWPDLYHALTEGRIPLAPSEEQVLRLACSLAVPGVPAPPARDLAAAGIDAGMRDAVVDAYATALGVTR